MLDEKLKSMTMQPKEEKKGGREELHAGSSDFHIKEHVENLADKDIIKKNGLDLDEDDLPPPLL